jgi:hypothetical protein
LFFDFSPALVIELDLKMIDDFSSAKGNFLRLVVSDRRGRMLKKD